MIKVAPGSGREQCSKCLWWGHDCTACRDSTEVIKCGNKDLCGNCFLAGHGNSTCRFPGGIAADKARPEETYRFGSIIAMNERRQVWNMPPVYGQSPCDSESKPNIERRQESSILQQREIQRLQREIKIEELKQKNSAKKKRKKKLREGLRGSASLC